jgi:hypothetical protein
MTAVVLASILLTIPFLVAFIGIPLWMTFKRPETGADHTGAQRYLRARSARTRAVTRAAAVGAEPAPAGLAAVEPAELALAAA